MRKMILLAAALLAGLFAYSKELKILTIGNSFSNSVFTYLPKLVEEAKDCKLVMDRAALGGCPLKRHWELAEQCEANPNLKPYPNYTTGHGRKKDVYSLKDLLVKEKWDIITIQQASHESWKEASYFPYAEKLCAYVKKYCPDAKIYIQQTWAYRFDDPRLTTWGITPEIMYEKLNAAYAQAAAKLNIPIIPVGEAVDTARKTQPEKYVRYNIEDYKDFKTTGNIPGETGSFVTGYTKRTDKKTGKMIVGRDTFHLNQRGEYLQACVWFATLFDRPLSEIKSTPKGMKPEDAAFLRGVAQKISDKHKNK